MRSRRPAFRAGPSAGLGLKAGATAAVLFLHVPLAFIVLYAFSSDAKTFSFPPPGLTTQWFGMGFEPQDIRDALGLSLKVAAVSTAVAMVLGTLAAAAVWRSRFFGREAVSLLARLFAPFLFFMVLDVSENSICDEVRKGPVFRVSLALKEIFELGRYSNTDHNFHGSL